MAQVIGVVLSGGGGRRLGRDKGSLEVHGVPLAERAARALWPLCGSVLVSVPPGGINPAPAFSSIEDAPPAGRGPLAGLEAAFAATGASDLLVLACDYPLVRTSLLQAIRRAADDDHDLVMPVDGAGRDHPLVGLWRRSAEGEVRQALEQRIYKVRSLLAGLRVRRLGPAEIASEDLDRALLNINRPEDLERLGAIG
jgi:molybdenum cofactor guanylyltransferase